MHLIVGGFAQGKLDYACTLGDFPLEQQLSGANCPLDTLPPLPLFNKLHLFVRRSHQSGIDPWPLLQAYLQAVPHGVILCDEVGGGIVPLQASERDWREAVGRICCRLAAQATQVDRVVCGIPQCIKGGTE